FEGVLYRGIIKGREHSVVAVSVFPKYVRVVMADNGGNYILGALGNEKNKYIFYNEHELKIQNPHNCSASDEIMPFHGDMPVGIDIKESLEDGQKSMMNCVPIYVECDFRMYQDNGSNVTTVNNFVTALINEVEMIYLGLDNMDIALSNVFVHTSADPYASTNDISQVLEDWGRTVQDNPNGRLKHFISTRGLGGGIAWLDVLCDDYFEFNADFDDDGFAERHYAGPFAVSANMGTSVTNFPTYSWEVEVFSHEMGHNWFSPHTQACRWNGNNTVIDGCVGSEGSCANGVSCPSLTGQVMSYCHLTSCGINLNNGFGRSPDSTEPGDMMRSRFNNPSNGCDLTCGGGNGSTCAINNITAGSQTACNSNTNEYTQQITVTFTDAPATGNLIVNSQSFAIGTSPRTITLTGLTADGNNVDVTARFSDETSCALIRSSLFTAPDRCDGEGCMSTPLTCGQVYDGTNAGGTFELDSYNCIFNGHTGPEVLYEVTLTGATTVAIALTNLTADLDLILLNDECGQTTCFAGSFEGGASNETVSFSTSSGGTFYIAIDGWDGAVSTYSLEVTSSGCLLDNSCTTAPPSSGEITSGSYRIGNAIATTGYIADGSNVILQSSSASP
ncbi:MAG: M12 family metallo-peptidase, partial [Saprospiraceae bacterium]